LDQQYLLGPNLLIAPIFREDGEVEFYIPESEEDGDAEWVGLLNGKRYKPGKWYKETHDFMSLPIIVRPNVLIVRNTMITLPEQDITQGLEAVYGHITKDVSVKIVDADAKSLGEFRATAGKDGEVSLDGGDLKGEAKKAGIDL
jgi:alpha-D-xyloside xylohydrolase